MNDTTSSLTYMASMSWFLKLLRPKQWIKNGFVLMPLVFSGYFLSPAALFMAFTAFVTFSLMSSCTYIINDIHDIDSDKLHPSKSKTRPLAAGYLSIKQACCLLVSLYLILIGIGYCHPQLFFPVAAYAVLNLIYTYHLKNEPVIDIFIIAIGFVLRVVAGAVAIQVEVSSWMVITSLALALYLGASKRRQELIKHQSTCRKSLEKYTLALIEKYAMISAICSITFYSLFVMTVKPQLIYTIPLTLFGIFRYWYLVECLEHGESPTDALFEDWQLAVTVLFWLISCILILWPIGN